MIKNYFKTALRNILRHKSLSFINVLGLATGIACCMLIALYVFHETSYDRFNANADRIVRVTMEYAADGVPTQVAVTGNRVGPEFRRGFPEVESAVRTYPVARVVKYGEKVFDEKGFVYADSTLFDIFSFHLVQGSPHSVLNEPNEIVLNQSSAKKYFGTENPVGKLLRINNDKDYTVTGVMEDVPANSQVKLDMVASWYSLDDPLYKEESWWDASYYTYLLLRKPGMEKAVQAKIPAYLKSKGMESSTAAKSYMTLHLQPLSDVHLYAKVGGGFEPGGDYRYVYIFIIISLLILVIASANYINLTTARATERAREVGVRKVMGALRKQLFGQFIGESILTVSFSLIIGLLLVRLFLPSFNLLSGKEFSFGSLLHTGPVITMSTILLLVGLLGGIYPALVLSGFSPVKVLKGNFKTGISGVWLRKSLIVGQFIISVGLIVCTIVIQSQLKYIHNKKLGYNNDYVAVLPLDKFIQPKLHTIKSEFLSNPEILGVTSCNQTPTFIPGKYNLRLDDHEMIVGGVRVDRDFIKTLGISIKTGSDFTLADEESALAGTDTIQRPVILNESAVKLLGWSADEAVGKRLLFQGRNSVIKGIVNDFHFSSMHETIGPLVIFIGGFTRSILAKLSGRHLSQTIQFMKAKWDALITHRPFEYEFLDDQFDKLYKSETTTGRLFSSFALLAIGLACLGLLGLITFTAQQRTKEIGIRKVLGASAGGIVLMLSKDFLKLIGIASLLAFPLAWWGMNKWLQEFAYRVNVGWWAFVLAGAIALAIALLTVSFQAIKAAVANPVKSLRTL